MMKLINTTLRFESKYHFPQAHYVWHHPVVTCEQAAIGRGIKLKQELKTILLKMENRSIAVHLRGCDRVNFRKVKKIFSVKNIQFIAENYLPTHLLSKGTINPWNVPFCSYHLLCIKVFYNRYVATNASNYDTGILFESLQLLDLPNLILGEFGK